MCGGREGISTFDYDSTPSLIFFLPRLSKIMPAVASVGGTPTATVSSEVLTASRVVYSRGETSSV